MYQTVSVVTSKIHKELEKLYIWLHGPSIGRDGALPKNDCRVKTYGPPAVGKNVYARGTSDAALKAV